MGLIKVDVEGFEPEVIRGALETIKKSHPVLVLSFYHTPEEFYEIKGYIEASTWATVSRYVASPFACPSPARC